MAEDSFGHRQCLVVKVKHSDPRSTLPRKPKKNCSTPKVNIPISKKTHGVNI